MMKIYIMILVSIIMIMGLTGCEKKDMSYTKINMEEAVAMMATVGYKSEIWKEWK